MNVPGEYALEWQYTKYAMSLAHRELLDYVFRTSPERMNLNDLQQLREDFDEAAVNMARLQQEVATYNKKVKT